MLVSGLMCAVLAADPVIVEMAAPDFDRWNYGFNSSPGTRSVGSTFSAYQSGYPFDDRDGQVLLGFVTGDAVEPGYPASAYRIVSCTVTVSMASDDIVYDPTLDGVTTYLPEGEEDVDAGRPVIVTGVGFRNGWSAWTFGEDGEFGEVMAFGVRNAYPIDFDSSGNVRDISNSITEGFDPHPWSVGEVAGIQAGALVPAYGVVTFDLDVTDADIQCYLRHALSEGLLDVMVSSLHPASEPGSGGESNYPDWILKENPLVDLGVASAAGLSLSTEIVEPTGVTGDVTGDGAVDVEDLLATLAAFGHCPCCPEDSDGSGAVDVDDLLSIIAEWSN